MSLLGGLAGAIAAASGQAYAKVVNATNPAAWWSLDGNLLNRIGSNHGAIGTGAESYATALPEGSGGAFNCAGMNWVSVDHAPVLKPAVGSITCWIKPATLQDANFLSINAAGANAGDLQLLVRANGTIRVEWQDGMISQVAGPSSPYYSSGQIVHVLVTFDGTGFSLYLDGNRQPPGLHTGYTGGLSGNTHPIVLGTISAAGGEPIFDGLIDEVAIWNRVLTRNEIYLLAQTEPDE
jgi:Concanavalin A-like lectin/glucanases superfamily